MPVPRNRATEQPSNQIAHARRWHKYLHIRSGETGSPQAGSHRLGGTRMSIPAARREPWDGVFTDVEDVIATLSKFTPGDAQVGLRLRVKATYTDGASNIETVFSDPTNAVININDPPIALPTVSDTSPTQGLAVTAATGGIVDVGGTDAAVFTFQREELIASACGCQGWSASSNSDHYRMQKSGCRSSSSVPSCPWWVQTPA